MKLDNKFWLFVAVCTIFTGGVAATLSLLFWQQITPAEQALLVRLAREQAWYFFSTAVFLFAAFGFTLDWFFRFYIIPLNQLIEEMRVMNSVNPAHRLKIDGSRVVVTLAELINTSADRYAAARHTMDQAVEAAKAKTEAEKAILASIMAELTQGVLICDAVGRILLYNRRAQAVLNKVQRPNAADPAHGNSDRATDGFVGLHRSVYALIDRNLVQYALKDIQRKLAQKRDNVSSHFVVVTQDRRQLRVETLPILDADQRFAGFALIFADITRHVEQSDRMNQRLNAMAKNLRSSVAAIRSTVDLMIQFPDMDPERKNDFLARVAAETQSLSRMLRTELTDIDGFYPQSRWPLFPMLVSEWVSTIKSEALSLADLTVEMVACDSRCMVRVDNHGMILAMRCIVEKLEKEGGVRCSRMRLTAPGNLVQLDLVWQGPPIPIETVRHWCEQPLMKTPIDGCALTLKEVLEHNRAEIWPHTDGQRAGEACLRLFIPMVQSAGAPADIRQVTLLPKGRPEFYDFDLFNQTDQAAAVADRMLRELNFTVFDTETTGLDPRGGDAIISIGAVRVVNGRLLPTETIHQLVDPRRPVSELSTRYHGIDNSMLVGMPSIETVLPYFERFARDTVLVAHNAAFDMRMLQMQEQTTGIRFTNPVLDTMHLSAIVHPAHHDHSLESIAQRLGVSITKRHDALGDAMATAEIFLKIIPLLNEKGIYTLKDALTASRRTYYARLKY